MASTPVIVIGLFRNAVQRLFGLWLVLLFLFFCVHFIVTCRLCLGTASINIFSINGIQQSVFVSCICFLWNVKPGLTTRILSRVVCYKWSPLPASTVMSILLIPRNTRGPIRPITLLRNSNVLGAARTALDRLASTFFLRFFFLLNPSPLPSLHMSSRRYKVVVARARSNSNSYFE